MSSCFAVEQTTYEQRKHQIDHFCTFNWNDGVSFGIECDSNQACELAKKDFLVPGQRATWGCENGSNTFWFQPGDAIECLRGL